MEKRYIKRFAMILTVLVTLGIFGNLTFGTEHSTKENVEISGEMVQLGPIVEENQNTEDSIEKVENADIPDASKEIINNVTENEPPSGRDNASFCVLAVCRVWPTYSSTANILADIEAATRHLP